MIWLAVDILIEANINLDMKAKERETLCLLSGIIKVSGATARWPFTDSDVPSSLLLLLFLF